MATMVLKPNGNGSTRQHTPVGDAVAWRCVDDVSPDGDTTYNESLVASGGGIVLRVDLFSYQNPPAGKLGVINSVSLYTSSRYQFVGLQNKLTPLIRPTGVNHGGLQINLLNAYPSPPDIETWATNPDDLAAWEWADLTNCQGGYSTLVEDNGADADARITDQYMVVDYVDVYDPGTYADMAMTAMQPEFVGTAQAFIPDDAASMVMTAVQPMFVQQYLTALFVFDPRSMST